MQEYDETVQAFENGAKYMKRRVLDYLTAMRDTAPARGSGRYVLDMIVEAVRKMEVRT